MPLLLPLVALAFALSLLFHSLAVKFFPRFGLTDNPEKYNLQRQPLPYPTGIISVGLFLILFCISQGEATMQNQGLAICIILLGVVSFIDDRKNLPTWIRLSVQILIGFLLFATGTRIYTITNPLGGLIKLDTIDIMTNAFGPLPLWSGVFTIVWVLLTTNAFNWLDGIPGQSSVLTVIGSATIGFLAMSDRVNQPEIALIAFLLTAVAAGSMMFDLPPNRAVLGDTGAMFFGLMLGTLSIYAGGKVATAFLVLGVPILDAVFVIGRRIRAKRSPLSGDLDHLHHRLLKKGWTETNVILLNMVIGTAFGLTALFLSTTGKFIAIIILTALILVLTRFAGGTRAADYPQ